MFMPNFQPQKTLLNFRLKKTKTSLLFPRLIRKIHVCQQSFSQRLWHLVFFRFVELKSMVLSLASLFISFGGEMV